MEAVEQQTDEEHSVKRPSTADSGHPTADHSLLSVRTLRPWQIPEHCMVSV